MVDHLHPNLTGYKLLAKAFYIAMRESKLLPQNPLDYSIAKQDSILNRNFPFTSLDSVISNIAIERLKNNYPFVKKGMLYYSVADYQSSNFIDSVAKSVMVNEIAWEQAHSQVAQWYWEKHEVEKFLKELDAIIAERPYDDEPYNYLATKLIANSLFEKAQPYLENLNKIKPSAFTNKWLGQIALNNNNLIEAVSFLRKSLQFKNDDPQVWYNLAGAYFNLNQLNDTIDALKTCLTISPNYQPAQIFYGKIRNSGLK
jgi:predicted Zn-dependent protease